MNARFLQIHTLHSYTSVLLNRDDSGLAKRLPYGGVMRTRISSQCLKRHWRLADDPHALARIAGATDAFRSRELVTRKVLGPLAGTISQPTLDVLDELFQATVYGEKGTDTSKRQTLPHGLPCEIETYQLLLSGETATLCGPAISVGSRPTGIVRRTRQPVESTEIRVTISPDSLEM